MDTYEQKYKELLERAKVLKSRCKNKKDRKIMIYRIEDIEFMFPELKESKDECIRKAIIDYFDDANKSDENPLQSYGIQNHEAITWLEKQKPIDEKELKKGALKYVARQFMKWLDASIPKDEMCLSNAECKVIEDAFLKDDWATISHYMCEKLKRQGEQIELKKVKQDNHPRIVMADFNGGEGFFKLNLDNLNKEQVDAIEMMINNPKQGEQTQLDYEHADIPKKDFAPIEPKFKVGDWVVKQNGENFWNGDCVAQITNITDCDKHWLNIDCWVKAEDIRLWSIQDANDGDVLVSSEGNPFIFSGKYDDIHFGNPIAYCGVNCENKFKKSSGTHWTNKNGVYPATKEQQDLLFSKMKEAGWEWDTKNKELKKMEIASKESEDEKIRKEIIDFFELPHPQFVGKRDQEKWLAWIEKQGNFKIVDSSKVIEWIHKYWPFSWGNFSLQVDDAIDKFKKDFGLC